MAYITDKRLQMYIDNIRNLSSEPATYVQAAEECYELAQALLKYARILRSENPASKDRKEVICNIIEEYSYLELCLRVLDIPIELPIQYTKAMHWIRRLNTMLDQKSAE